MDNGNVAAAKSRLDQISTQWNIVNDPPQFVSRYAAAIRKYLHALIRHEHDAEEVAQDFLLQVTSTGFARVRMDAGRFRDYLRAAVRNAALTFLRRGQPELQASEFLEQLPGAEDAVAAAERKWLAGWRECILKRAWRALKQHESCSPGNLCFTVLRLEAHYPRENSQKLAEHVTKSTGHSLTAQAYRKQVSRARALLARLIVEQVAQTLDVPTPEAIEEELVAIGLMAYLKHFLAADRTTWMRYRGPA